jgi:hypothetical protein
MKLDPRLNGASPDQKAQAMYQAEAKALFVKYKVQSIYELYTLTHAPPRNAMLFTAPCHRLLTQTQDLTRRCTHTYTHTRAYKHL